jgi:hypothetical protein
MRWYGTYMEIQSLHRKNYRLYKKILKKQRTLLTYKELGAMYGLALSYEKDKEFVAKVKKIYDGEIDLLKHRKIIIKTKTEK